MKSRVRVLAGILCACMLMTSNATYVLAEGTSENSTEVQVLENGEEPEGSLSDEGNGEDVSAASEVSDESAAFSEEGAMEGTDAQETESSLVEETSTETVTASETETWEESAEETFDETETVTAPETETETESETETETEAEMESEIEIETESETETEIETETESGDPETDIAVMAVERYQFGVEEDGTLKVLSGTLSGVINNIPAGTKRIPKGIFNDNSEITKIVIPSGVEEFEAGAFKGCSGLLEVEFENNKTSATEFPEELFAECSKLRGPNGGKSSFTIPEGVVTIGTRCFSGCSNGLNSVEFSSSVEEIGLKAFEGCSSLVDVSLSNVEVIGAEAFKNCAELETVIFSADLRRIGGAAFNSCKALTSVNLSGNKSNELVVENGAFINCSGLKTVILPASMAEIAEEVFRDCTALTSLTIKNTSAGEGIRVIRTNAFLNCTALAAIDLSESVSSIESDAFAGCTALKNITIQNGKNADVSVGSEIELPLDAFPTNTGLVVSGYGGTVEEWVGRVRAAGFTTIKYVALYTSYTLQANCVGSGKVSLNKATAKEGDTVSVTVTPESGYALKNIYYGENELPLDANMQFTVAKTDANDNKKIKVTAEFVKADALAYNSLAFRVNGIKKEAITLASVWTSQTLKLVYNDNGIYREIGNWAWDYSSNYPNVVSVTKEGVVRAVAMPSASQQNNIYITAKLKANPKIKVELQCFIENDAKLASLDFVEAADASKRLKTADELEDGMKVFWYSKAWVETAVSNKQTRNFEVNVSAINEQGKTIDADLSWSSSDTSVAKVSSSKTTGSKNMISVCGIGEAVITVSSTNAAKDGVKPLKFVVRVLDLTPRMVESSLSLNLKSENTPASFTLLPVYGSTLQTGESELCKIVNGKWEKVDDFYVNIEDYDAVDQCNKVSFDLYSNSDYVRAEKATTVKGLYLKVKIEGEDDQYVKLPNIAITNTLPKVTVKLSGKINKFYTGSSANQTRVTAAVTYPKGYELEKAPYLENLDTKEANAYFEDNFTIDYETYEKEGKLIIQQKEDVDQLLPAAKPSVSGYLCFKYKGLEAVKVKITVGTETKQPSYSITPASSTANVYAKGQMYEIQLYNKGTKKNENLKNFTVTCSASGSTGVFAYGQVTPEISEDGSYILLKLPENADIVKSKAVLTIKGEDWSAPLSYTFTLNTVNKKPTAKLAASTITINRSCYDSNSTTVTLNQTDAKLTEMKKVIPSKVNVEAEKIDVTFETDENGNGKIVARIKEGVTPKKGTYSYQFVPYVVYAGTNQTEELAKLTVKVKIDEKQPYLKLKSASYKLNAALLRIPYEETAETDITWMDLPTEGGFKKAPDTSEMKIICNKVENDNLIQVAFDDLTGKMKVSLKAGVVIRTGKMSVELQGLKAVRSDGGMIELKPLKFTVNVYDSTPTISLKASGSINVLNPDSEIVYTPTIKNFNGSIESVTVNGEIDENDKWQWAENGSENIHFTAELDEKGKIHLSAAKNGLQKRSYTVQLKLIMAGKEYVKDVKFTPTQTMPKVKQGTTAMTFYKGVPGYSVSTTVTRSKDTEANISDVVWAKAVKENDVLRQAFEEPYFENGKLTIKLKNPTLLKKGSTYTLTFAVYCENQLDGVEGTNFKIKVTVK